MSEGSHAPSTSVDPRGRLARDVVIATTPLALSVVVTAAWAHGPISVDVYLPFHTLVELFAATVSLLVFSIGWNTPETGRRPGNEALRESESRFRQLAENVREMFWLRELDGRLVYMSPGFETIFGCPVDAAGDVDDPVALVHPDDRARVREHLSRARPGERHVVEYRIARPDGVERWVRAATFPVLDAAGRLVRLAGVGLDVTDERRAAETLARAQRMEALGRVAGGVAHDFNNLLTVVFASVEFARDAIPATDPAQEELTQIAEAARRARDLTRQLLAFARRQPSQTRRVDMAPVVAEVARMSRAIVGSSVELSVVVEPGVFPVTVDPTLIEQVLLNVVVNAKDAMPRGGALTLSLGQVSSPPDATAPPGRWARLRFVDTGTGMSAEVVQRAFDPFFTTKPLGQGTGLGLATSFGVVSQAGGHITLDSALGEGTTVTILLPLSEGALDAPTQDPDAPAARGRGETVLLAEDEPVVRDFAARMLRDGGYAVLVAANGLDALEVAAAHEGPIDLLLSDVVMPLCGGPDLAARLLAARPGTRVLFVSGYTGDAGDALAHPVVPKPYTSSALLRRVREALDAAAPRAR